MNWLPWFTVNTFVCKRNDKLNCTNCRPDPILSKDFAAFGEETTAARSSGNGYTTAAEPRGDYTGYEKDMESGLEYAQARFYNPTHGRYTSIDPMASSAAIRNPQTFNRYSYVLNSPYKFVDPLGLIAQGAGGGGGFCAAEFSSCDDGEEGSTSQAQQLDNPTYSGSPVPGTAYFDVPAFSDLDKKGTRTDGTYAARQLLVDTNGGDLAAAETQYKGFTKYEQAVFLNTMAALVDQKLDLKSARFEGFYNDHRGNEALPFGVTLSGVTTKQLDAAQMGTAIVWIGPLPVPVGRRSPRVIKTASLEASVDSKTGFVGFDVDLYNIKSNLSKHSDEVGFNSGKTAATNYKKVTTHPADVARALRARGVRSGVITQ